MKLSILSNWPGRLHEPVRTIVLGLTLAAVACWATPAFAISRTWTGTGANAFWSTAGNWSPAGPPVGGDSLTFPSTASRLINTNDLPGLHVRSIVFNGAAGGVTLRGNVVLVDVDVTAIHAAGFDTVDFNLEFPTGGALQASQPGTLIVNGNVLAGGVNPELVLLSLSYTNLIVTGPISGNCDVVKLGDGVARLNGSSPNTYSGTTYARAGTLRLSHSGADRTAIPGPLVIGDNTAFLANVVDDFSGQYSSGMDVTVSSNGVWTLTFDTTISQLTLRGGLVDGAGTLSLAGDVNAFEGAGSFYPAIKCPLHLGAQTRTFRVTDFFNRLVLDGTVSGVSQAGITLVGGGDIFMTTSNSYPGLTTISNGLILVEDRHALGAAGPGAGTIIHSAGALTFSDTLFDEDITLNGGAMGNVFVFGVELTGSVTVLQRSTVYSTAAGLTLIGGITGPGSVTANSGRVRVTGTAPNTLAGGISLTNVFGGTNETLLELAKPGGVPAVGGHLGLTHHSRAFWFASEQANGASVSFLNGGLIDFDNHSDLFGEVTFIGRGEVDQMNFLSLTGAVNVVTGLSNATVSLSGPLVLPVNLSFNVSNTIVEPAITLSGSIQGAGGFTKSGPATMRIASSGTYSGPVTVAGGLLRAGTDTALGATSAGTAVLDGGTLEIETSAALAEPLNIRGAGRNGTDGALFLGPATGVQAGVVLAADATVRNDLAFAILSGVISGPGGLTKIGPAPLQLGGGGGAANTYAGTTRVNAGEIVLSKPAGVVVVPGPLIIGTGSGVSASVRHFNSSLIGGGGNVTVNSDGLWNLLGFSQSVSRLVGNGTVDLGSNSVLTVSNSVSCEFAGAFTGVGSLNKLGLATFHVTGQSPSYTGPATVFDGTYKVDGFFGSSPVTVKVSSVLRGSGAVGDVTVENGGVVRVDPPNTGVLGGAMQFNSVNFHSGGVLGAQFYGPHPTAGNDGLYVLNGVTLSTPALSSGFGYPPHEGDIITLIEKIASGPISGNFSGFPEGALKTIGQIPVVVSYLGGNGNEMTLTVTNLPLGGGGAQLVSGNNGSMLVPNDCDLFWLAVTNRGATTISNLRGTLRSLTDGVVVTIPEAAFPNLAPNARGTNLTPFQIRTEPTFPCGAGAQFELILTASNAPAMALLYTLIGSSGYALNFDGRDDQVEIAANTFSSVVNNFTIELWANPAGNRTQTAETNSGVSGVSLPLRQLQRFAVFPDRGNLAYGASHVSAGLSIGKNGISAYEHGTNLPLGTVHLPSRLVYSNAISGWTHVALVYTNRAPRLYVNGALVRSGAASLYSSVHPSGSLGGSPQADYGNFDGQLDEVRIWNVALGQTQIQSNMTRSLTGTEANLVTYFRCDEGGGSLLGDSASASPSPIGTVTNGAAFVLSDRGPFTLPGGPACDSGGGACESCIVASGTFTTSTPTLLTPLSPDGSPSICFPPKLCPGPFPIALPPTPFIQHKFVNTGSTQMCVTAQLRFNCPAAPQGALHAAAYLGSVNTNDPCVNFLGDGGGDGSAAFSFPVPAGSNVVIVVTSWTPGIGCDDYQLELFGLPCPPPFLAIDREAEPAKLRVHWSTAYPGWTAQSSPNVNGVYADVPIVPAMINSRFALTNLSATSNEFFRLREP